jgi:hypothetical protein
MSKKIDAQDPRWHYEIWSGPSHEFNQNNRSIYYVENHNSQCGYAELALDFSIAVDSLIAQYKKTDFGNWVGPIAHMSRQLVELLLKSLMETIKATDNTFNTTPLQGHNLQDLWVPCRNWLIQHGYKLPEDARLEMTERLILAFHEIDPSGDLFRFGISRKTAYGKQKSYDRVGIDREIFEKELDALRRLLNHWEATIFRKALKIEMGWEEDPLFDANDFPRNC